MAETTEVLVCTKCKIIPRAYQRAEATNRWCRGCRNGYALEYSKLNLDRKERTGFIKGREAMREIIVLETDKLGSGMLSGYEIATLVQQMPGPQLADD